FLGHAARIDAVADDLRANEDDQLGSLPAASVVGKGIADPIQLFEDWNAGSAAVLGFADQAGEQDGLAACNRDRTPDLALRDGRGQGPWVGVVRDIADLVLNVEEHVSIHVDPWHDAQDNARGAIVDIGHNRRARRRYGGRRLGRDRDLIADLQGRDLVVEHDERWRREDLEIRYGAQRIEDDFGILLGPDQEIEARYHPVDRGVRNHSAGCGGCGGDNRFGTRIKERDRAGV